jgi:hypothetical protein
MNNSKTSKFDWNNFIQAMSNITNMPTVRDMLYENTKELHKKDIPSFKEQFIKKSREISYDERKEYYNKEKVNSKSIELIENFSFEFAIDGSYDISKVFEYDKQFGKLHKWFQGNPEKWKLTRVWLYSFGREADLIELDIAEKIFLLDILLENKLIHSDKYGLNSGEDNCKLLGIIMNVPWTSIEMPLKLVSRDSFADFAAMTDSDAPAAAKKKKRIEKMIQLLEVLQVNKKFISLLDAYILGYKQKFE